MIPIRRLRTRKLFRRLIDKKGCYFIFNKGRELFYVGHSINLFSRLSNHVVSNTGNFKKDDIQFFSFLITNDHVRIEKILIYKYRPPRNLHKPKNMFINKTVESTNLLVAYPKQAFETYLINKHRYDEYQDKRCRELINNI